MRSRTKLFYESAESRSKDLIFEPSLDVLNHTRQGLIWLYSVLNSSGPKRKLSPVPLYQASGKSIVTLCVLRSTLLGIPNLRQDLLRFVAEDLWF